MSTRSTAALFEAAREDAPSADARDAMWSRISAASTVTTAAAGAASLATKSAAPAAATSGVLGTKLVIAGGIVGACGAVLGVVLTLLVVSADRAGTPAPSATAAPRRTPAAAATGARLAEPAARKLDFATLEAVTAIAAPATKTPLTGEEAPNADPASDLSMEAKLVSDARAALMRGEPDLALALVKRTHRLATRALEPEELGIESRALRSLGRVDEAAAIDLLLKRRFPDSALAR